MSKIILGAVLSAVLAATVPASAQTSGIYYPGLVGQQYAAKDRLIGANVLTRDGKVIGDIKDLILNASNEVEGVLLGTGGILGAGEKEVGVRYGALKFDRKDGKLTITLPSATKEVIAGLPAFDHGPRKSLAQKLADKAQALKDKTAAGAGPALEKAKAAAGPMLDKAKAAGSAAVDKAKELGGAALDKGKEAATAAKDKAATIATPAPAAPKQ